MPVVGWVELLVLDRSSHPEGAVAALPVVENLKVFEDRVGEFDAGLPAFAVEELVCIRPQNDAMPALSKQSPIEPIEATRPASWVRRVKAQEVNWADSVVGMDQRARGGAAVLDRHPQCVGHQRRSLGGVDRVGLRNPDPRARPRRGVPMH
jgi:hypothetical protein